MAALDATAHVRRLRTVSEGVAKDARKLEEAESPPSWADLAALAVRLDRAAKVATCQLEELAHATHRDN